jgi:DNA processing protein
VETAEHIAEELASQLGDRTAPMPSPEDDTSIATGLTPDHAELLDCMGFDPVSTDQLVQKSRFSAAEISSMLLLLELQGHVSSESGGLFTRLGNRDT